MIYTQKAQNTQAHSVCLDRRTQSRLTAGCRPAHLPIQNSLWPSFCMQGLDRLTLSKAHKESGQLRFLLFSKYKLVTVELFLM